MGVRRLTRLLDWAIWLALLPLTLLMILLMSMESEEDYE